MEFNEFKNYICSRIGERLGDDYSLRTAPVIKNNGIVLTGVSFIKKNATIAPTIYMEAYYEAYEGGAALGYIVDSLVDVFLRNDYSFDLDFGCICEFDRIKERIRLKLVNYKRNLKATVDCPYIKIMDLCVMFYIFVGSSDGEAGAIRITNDMLENWGLNNDDLYKLALENTKTAMKMDVMNIREVLAKMLGKCEDSEDSDFLSSDVLSNDQIPMYVISNHQRFYGATCLLFTEEIRRFADAVGSDLYILPSSVHELIAIPDYEEADPSFLYEMVKDVNENEVSERDFLSTNVYKFSRKDEQMFSVYGG